MRSQFETYDGESGNDSHGYDGPMHVSGGLFRSKAIEDDFINAAKPLGYHEVQDLQDLETVNAVSVLRRFVSPEDGKRQDAAHAYLHPLLKDGDHPNLHVLVGSQVTRVILDEGKRATGVEFRPNPALMTDPISGKPVTELVRARRMVIVTAGAFGSPTILERSGVGDREVLQRAEVPVIWYVHSAHREWIALRAQGMVGGVVVIVKFVSYTYVVKVICRASAMSTKIIRHLYTLTRLICPQRITGRASTTGPGRSRICLQTTTRY